MFGQGEFLNLVKRVQHAGPLATQEPGRNSGFFFAFLSWANPTVSCHLKTLICQYARSNTVNLGFSSSRQLMALALAALQYSLGVVPHSPTNVSLTRAPRSLAFIAWVHRANQASDLGAATASPGTTVTAAHRPNQPHQQQPARWSSSQQQKTHHHTHHRSKHPNTC